MTNSEWLAEFRGFFWGEGNFMIDIMHRKVNNYLTYDIRVRVRIIQRDDERPVLMAIQKRFGGHVTTHKAFMSNDGRGYLSHKQITWQCTARDQVKIVLDALDNGHLPHSKHFQIAVMREAMGVMQSRRHKYTDEQIAKLRELKNRLQNLRKYVGS